MTSSTRSDTTLPTPDEAATDLCGPVLAAGLVYALIGVALIVVAFLLPPGSVLLAPAALIAALFCGASLFCSVATLTGE